MLELKNKDNLSSSFSTFEKYIEENLVDIHINNTKYEKRFKEFKKRIAGVEGGKNSGTRKKPPTK
jgi:hypothetical protein